MYTYFLTKAALVSGYIRGSTTNTHRLLASFEVITEASCPANPRLSHSYPGLAQFKAHMSREDRDAGSLSHTRFNEDRLA